MACCSIIDYQPIVGDYSLHSLNRGNLSKFWTVFNRIQKQVQDKPSLGYTKGVTRRIVLMAY